MFWKLGLFPPRVQRWVAIYSVGSIRKKWSTWLSQLYIRTCKTADSKKVCSKNCADIREDLKLKQEREEVKSKVGRCPSPCHMQTEMYCVPRTLHFFQNVDISASEPFRMYLFLSYKVTIYLAKGTEYNVVKVSGMLPTRSGILHASGVGRDENGIAYFNFFFFNSPLNSK
jgi:hypothetical protein